MATITLMVVGTAAEGFLLYLVIQFARELRKNRMVCASIAVIAVSGTFGENTPNDQEPRKVIEITCGSRLPFHTSGPRMVS
jgi:hypothetical protein